MEDELTKLSDMVRSKWQANSYIETTSCLPKSHYDLPWIKYESYMRAQLIQSNVGYVGKLIVDFPESTTEDNQLHTHPISDRIVTVLKGNGYFICQREGKILEAKLSPGIIIHMPRKVLHTFISGDQGLVVKSVHAPFVDFHDPLCIKYPKNNIAVNLLNNKE